MHAPCKQFGPVGIYLKNFVLSYIIGFGTTICTQINFIVKKRQISSYQKFLKMGNICIKWMLRGRCQG